MRKIDQSILARQQGVCLAAVAVQREIRNLRWPIAYLVVQSLPEGPVVLHYWVIVFRVCEVAFLSVPKVCPDHGKPNWGLESILHNSVYLGFHRDHQAASELGKTSSLLLHFVNICLVGPSPTHKSPAVLVRSTGCLAAAARQSAPGTKH